MLKKVKVGLVGVALIVILMFVVATFNVGSVSASPTDNKNISDVKWVTKYSHGYGNITFAENPFTGNGFITPIVEKLPEPKYVEVDTPYGKVKATKETYEMKRPRKPTRC